MIKQVFFFGATIALVACGSAPSEATATFDDAVASSTATATGIDTVLARPDGERLAVLRYDAAARTASIRIAGEATVISLPELQLAQANELAYATWKFRREHAPEVAHDQYATCTPAFICGTFAVDGYRCSACAEIDADCSTGLQVDCLYQ